MYNVYVKHKDFIITQEYFSALCKYNFLSKMSVIRSVNILEMVFCDFFFF